MNENNKIEKIICFILRHLFILILMPKNIQFFVILALLFYFIIINKKILFFNGTTFCFILVGVIQLVSIWINSLGNHDASRIIASLNTCLIWILSGLIFGYVMSGNYNKEKINKLAFYNMMGLIILSIIYVIFPKELLLKINLFDRRIVGIDWLYGLKSYRFMGFMEYSNLVVLLCLLLFPFSFQYLKNRNANKFLLIIFDLLSSLPAIKTNSRMGIMLFIVITLIMLINTIVKDKKLIKLFYFIIFPVILVLVFANFQGQISNKINNLMNSRADSTSQRTIIYQKSIEKTINGHLILGCGIKDMTGEYPLGSHSTYIGLFYKTGLIGLIVGIIGFIRILISLIKNKIESVYILFYIGLLSMLLIEDIDGTNWFIFLFVVLYGTIVSRRKKVEEE